jgi:hypothetical protein
VRGPESAKELLVINIRWISATKSIISCREQPSPHLFDVHRVAARFLASPYTCNGDHNRATVITTRQCALPNPLFDPRSDENCLRAWPEPCALNMPCRHIPSTSPFGPYSPAPSPPALPLSIRLALVTSHGSH